MNSTFFAGNRARLRQLFTGTAPIVVTANGRLQRASDEAFPFAQDANFWYLTGIDEPDIILVLDKNKEYLIVPTREALRQTFDGAINTEELTKHSGIKNIINEHDGWRQLTNRLEKVKHVATLAANPKYIDQLGLYTNPARAELINKIKQINPGIELLDLREHLMRMRMVKQSCEVDAIKHAIDITAAALKEVTRPAKLFKYTYEYEIEADITRYFGRRAATHAFTPIVASGPRATTLHSIANNAALMSDELVVLDVGAEVNHYKADLTRTVALSKSVSKRQQTIYDAVLDAQAYAISLLKPGIQLREDYEKQMEEFVGEKLRELNLIKTIERDTVRKFFPHATSHFLGLDTHDAGDYQRPLEPGMVLTVEPGLYIPEESIGIRIEDDILITEDGNQILSAGLPKSLTP